MKSLIEKRSIVIDGRRSSVSLEDEFWNVLKEVARLRNVSLSALIREIKANRQSGSLSSAIRVFVVGVYRDQSEPRFTLEDKAPEIEASSDLDRRLA